ncbi:MAG: universal stress protein, partial [Chitinophagaceae bacterium]
FVEKDYNKALEFAIQLSNQLKTHLIAYHSIPVAPAPTAAMEGIAENIIVTDEAVHKAAFQQKLDTAFKHAGLVNNNASIIVEHTPMLVESIIDHAQKENADLIVMGTHGSSGLQKFFFGSNTSTLISKTDIPVLAIPENYQVTTLKEFLFSSDLENIAIELAELVPLVEQLNASLHIVFFDYGKDPEHKLLNNAKAILETIAYKNIRIIRQPANIEETLNKQIKNYLGNNKPDCLVMFTRERTLWDRLFAGSKTEDMSESLQIPLLSFKKGKARPVISF